MAARSFGMPATITCSATYTVTQAHLDTGSIVNHATASATFGGQPVTSNEAALTLPLLSVAVQRTGVVPTVNSLPLAGDDGQGVLATHRVPPCEQLAWRQRGEGWERAQPFSGLLGP